VVQVAVSGHGSKLVKPRVVVGAAFGWGRPESLEPPWLLGFGALGQGDRACFDELASLLKRFVHAGCHRPGGDRDQACDEPLGFSSVSLTAASHGAFDPADEHSTDVVGVPERSAGDQLRKVGLEVEVTRFGPAELGSERSERT